MARATSQSAEPRSWRHPPPPPQPTQPAPAQTACSDGEVGRTSYARQTRARQHGAVNAGQKGPELCLTRETPTIFSASVRARGSCDWRKGVRPLGPRVPGSSGPACVAAWRATGRFERRCCTAAVPISTTTDGFASSVTFLKLHKQPASSPHIAITGAEVSTSASPVLTLRPRAPCALRARLRMGAWA